MHTRAWKRHRQFKEITPEQLRAGDIIHCYVHDDQWEARAARVCMVRIDRREGIWDIPIPNAGRVERFLYNYRVSLVLRHVNLARLDAVGGKPFMWTVYPWNSVFRYEPEHPLALRR